MADKKKPDPQIESDDAALDDKSINDLLKEYADDVKDKDIDDFLQDAPEEEEDDDDAFENDDALMAEAPAKKSGGLLGLLLVLLLCGGAGAGAWWYMNRDDGMTNVMGGFQGEPLNNSASFDTSASTSALVPETPPALPNLNTSDVTVDVNEIEIPMPSANQPSAQSSLSGVMSDDLPPPPQPTTAQQDVASNDPVQAPATAPEAPAAAKAVTEWMAGGSSPMPDVPPVDEKLPPVTEAPVAELKAKPVKIDPTQTARPVKADPAAPAAAPAPKSAERTPARSPSPDDAALPPPYLAIQARKGVAPTRTTVITPPAPVGASEPDVYVRGSTAHTEPVSTRAEGIYREMVARGGGEIIKDQTIIQTPQAVTMVEQDVEYLVPAPAPAAPTPAVNSTLAISGGRSLPPGQTEAAVQPRAAAPVVNVPQTSETVTVIDDTVVTLPSAAPVQSVSTPSNAAAPNSAAALLQQAQSAEAAGQLDQALSLYQRALEADAVYGDGRSIDRGMVYDRIGAIRARR